MFFMYSESHWRADRAAEGDGLENRCVSNGTGGSNPSPSALVCVVTLRLQCHDTFLCTSHVVGGVVLTVAGFSAKTWVTGQFVCLLVACCVLGFVSVCPAFSD